MEEALLEIGSDDEVTVDGESLDVADILRAQPTPDNGGVEVTTPRAGRQGSVLFGVRACKREYTPTPSTRRGAGIRPLGTRRRRERTYKGP